MWLALISIVSLFWREPLTLGSSFQFTEGHFFGNSYSFDNVCEFFVLSVV